MGGALVATPLGALIIMITSKLRNDNKNGMIIISVSIIILGIIYGFDIGFFFHTEIVTLFISIIYISLAIGIYYKHNWARILLLASIIPLTILFCYSVINFYVVNPNYPDIEKEIIKIKLSNSLFAIPFILYCIFLLIHFNRKNVKNSFLNNNRT
jgi:hypothetical protein